MSAIKPSVSIRFLLLRLPDTAIRQDLCFRVGKETSHSCNFGVQ
ncbi:hypothetical protein CHK_0806 [Christensenella hongkongensis]|uniref:Uncharacterized protein n=1 Tax=Christensenella hongkongensis TaxID=270498 RepID=A0A0M2NN59_9FIRM|nr:hypothetical protein CHK_0806 [Christensenella hongkongensis]